MFIDLPLRGPLSPLASALLAAAAVLAGARMVRAARRRARQRRYRRLLAALRAGDEVELDERPPRLRNRARVQRLLSRHIRAARIRSVPAPAVVRYRVTAYGLAAKPTVTRSSGEAAFDEAVLQVLPRARFEPAYVYGLPIQVWVEQPFTFIPPGRGAALAGAAGVHGPSPSVAT